MSKTVYLITILSVVLLNSKTSFGQTLKKELGVCGKTMSALLVIAPKVDAELSDAFLQEEEFCDNGRYEQDANFIISLYNAKDQLVYDKRVFLSTIVIQEALDKKKGTFKKTKITEGPNSRIVKFPISKEIGEVKKYTIESLEDKKVFGKKTIKW